MLKRGFANFFCSKKTEVALLMYSTSAATSFHPALIIYDFPVEKKVEFEQQNPNTNFLAVTKGQLVYIFDETENNWSWAENENQEAGYIPSSCFHYVKTFSKKSLEDDEILLGEDTKYIGYEYETYYRWQCKSKCTICKKEIKEVEQHYFCLECTSSSSVCKFCFENSKQEIETSQYHVHGVQFDLNQEVKPLWLPSSVHPCLEHWKILRESSAETLKEAFLTYSQRPCLGFRTSVQESYHWYTYQQIYSRILHFKTGLQNIVNSSNKFVGLCSTNRIEWFIADWSCLCNGFVTVGLPLQMDSQQLQFMINNSHLNTIICSVSKANELVELCEIHCPTVEHVIVMPWHFHDNQQITLPSSTTRITVHSFDTVEKTDYSAQTCTIHCAQPNELTTIVYTSGSSGNPKGVMYTDQMVNQTIQSKYFFYKPLVMMSSSPLSHFSDRSQVFACIVNGGRVGMLTQMEHILDDFYTLKPTILSSTPRLFNQLYSIHQQGDKKTNHLLGGRILQITTGGAQTSQTVYQFLKDCFKVPVHNGYASTETGPILWLSSTYFDSSKLSKGVQIKLLDVPELNYFVNDGKGEVCVKSENMFQGYYGMPEKSRDCFTEDGFYKTGDIGMIDSSTGKIQLIDRKSSIFKLAQGEFVAPEQLEQFYLESSLIDQLFLYGDASKSFLIAIVVPNKKSCSQIQSEQELQSNLLQEMKQIALQHKLQSFEIPKGIIIHWEGFSMQNQLLTSTLKLKRFALSKQFELKLNQLYEQLESKQMALWEQLSSFEKNENAKLWELGVDSLSAVKLSTFLKEKYAIQLTANQLLNESVSSLLQQSYSSSSSQLWNPIPFVEKYWNMLQEQSSTVVITQTNSSNHNTDNDKPVILLTGCTGFLGIHLLYSLLQQIPQCHIIVLLRNATHIKEAMQRIQNTLLDYHLALEEEILLQRVTIVLGELSQTHLGLSKETWTQLTNTVTIIIHNAAQVNHQLPLEQLENDNCNSTVELLLLYLQLKQRKQFFFISTLSVLDSTTNVKEEEISTVLHTHNGYVQSKIVCELLLQKVRQEYLQSITILRPGLIGFSTNSGKGNENDWFHRFVKSCIQCKMFPQINNQESSIQMTPVNMVATMIVQFMMQTKNEKWIYHVVDSNCRLHWKQLGRIIVEYRKEEMSIVSHEEWLENAKQCKEFYPVSELFEKECPHDEKYVIESSFKGENVFQEEELVPRFVATVCE